MLLLEKRTANTNFPSTYINMFPFILKTNQYLKDSDFLKMYYVEMKCQSLQKAFHNVYVCKALHYIFFNKDKKS